jgi:adenylylsulfate kinase
MNSENGFALWLTGPPAAGKSTLAAALAEQLRQQGHQVQILDSDTLRAVLTPEPTYTQVERDWFYGVMVYIGQLLTKNGVNVIFAATAGRRAYREEARTSIARFAEVYVHCSLAGLQARDPKGIYAKAAAGTATNVPGLHAPYEPPLDPAVTIETERQSVAEGVASLLAYLATWLG